MKTKPSYILLFLLCYILSCKKEEIKTVSVPKQDTAKTATKTIIKNSDQEQFILDVIAGFKNKDAKFLNSLIDPKVGFYIIPGPGTLMHFEAMDKIDFTNNYLYYHKFGALTTTKYKLQATNHSPEYDCDNQKWDKYGLFLITGDYPVFENILIRQEMGQMEVNPQDIVFAKRIDAITKTVYFTEKDSDVVFGFAKKDGRYIITYIDVQKTYCDI